MATTSAVKVTLTLTEGAREVIMLPSPINTTLTDPDTGNPLWPAAFNAIKATYATKDGRTVEKATFEIVRTTITTIATDYEGTGAGDD